MDTTTFRPGPRCPDCAAGKTSYYVTLGVDHPENGRITALTVGVPNSAVEAIDLARMLQGARADMAYTFVEKCRPGVTVETDDVPFYMLSAYHLAGASLEEYTDKYGTSDATDLY